MMHMGCQHQVMLADAKRFGLGQDDLRLPFRDRTKPWQAKNTHCKHTEVPLTMRSGLNLISGCAAL